MKVLWEKTTQRAAEFIRSIGRKPTNSQDQSLLLKACALVEMGKMPEKSLAEAAEAIRLNKPRRWPAYLHTVLSNFARSKRRNLNALLSSIEVPQHVRDVEIKPKPLDVSLSSLVDSIGKEPAT
jgi:hypothetical protein